MTRRLSVNFSGLYFSERVTIIVTMTDTVVSALIGAASGSVVSTVTVHWLTQSREQAAWIRNCEKEEWTELLTALVNAETAFNRVAALITSDVFPQHVDAGHIAALASSVTDVYRILFDKLFIHDALAQGHLLEQWHKVQDGAYKAVRNTIVSRHDLMNVATGFAGLRSLMRDAALERMAPKTALQRLRFWKN